MDSMSDEEQARTLKETYWADNITNAEWPVMLQNVRNASTRSRLKRKVVGWLMTMGRIAALNPELYNQAVREARALYLRQIGSPHPMFSTEVADSVQPDDEVGAMNRAQRRAEVRQHRKRAKWIARLKGCTCPQSFSETPSTGDPVWVERPDSDRKLYLIMHRPDCPIWTVDTGSPEYVVIVPPEPGCSR